MRRRTGNTSSNRTSSSTSNSHRRTEEVATVDTNRRWDLAIRHLLRSSLWGTVRVVRTVLNSHRLCSHRHSSSNNHHRSNKVDGIIGAIMEHPVGMTRQMEPEDLIGGRHDCYFGIFYCELVVVLYECLEMG